MPKCRRDQSKAETTIREPLPSETIRGLTGLSGYTLRGTQIKTPLVRWGGVVLPWQRAAQRGT